MKRRYLLIVIAVTAAVIMGGTLQSGLRAETFDEGARHLSRHGILREELRTWGSDRGQTAHYEDVVVAASAIHQDLLGRIDSRIAELQSEMSSVSERLSSLASARTTGAAARPSGDQLSEEDARALVREEVQRVDRELGAIRSSVRQLELQQGGDESAVSGGLSAMESRVSRLERFRLVPIACLALAMASALLYATAPAP